MRELEATQKHTELTQILVLDYYDASKSVQHNLINVNYYFYLKKTKKTLYRCHKKELFI